MASTCRRRRSRVGAGCRVVGRVTDGERLTVQVERAVRDLTGHSQGEFDVGYVVVLQVLRFDEARHLDD